MKVSLVVASGAHEGKQIPIAGSQFLIGRDPQCQLRPASQAISKKHCGFEVRDGKVYVVDYGSTNGTTVNDEVIRGVEVAVQDGASVKIGPLDFVVRIEKSAPKPDGTPLPSDVEAAALAAVKAAAGTAARPPARDTTPNPAAPKKPVAKPGTKEAPILKSGSKEGPALAGSKEAAALAGSKEAAALKPPKPAPKPGPSDISDDDHDKIAAMLLDMDDGAAVPDGSTVMEIPSPLAEQPGGAAKPDDKGKKPVQTREDMTNAASDLLRKMMRRPK